MSKKHRSPVLFALLALIVFPVLGGAISRLWWPLAMLLKPVSAPGSQALTAVGALSGWVGAYFICRRLYRSYPSEAGEVDSQSNGTRSN